MKSLGYSIGLIALAAGCSTSDVTSASNHDLPELPRLETVGLDCTIGVDECQTILAGINYLQEHANPMCRIIGGNAQERFDAPPGKGFRAEAQIQNFNMSVYTIYQGSNIPADAYTNVHPSFWTSGLTHPSAAGGLLAHEEIHHLGMSEASALHYQDQCLNPQS